MLLLFKDFISTIFLQKEQQQNIQKLWGMQEAYSASGPALWMQHC